MDVEGGGVIRVLGISLTCCLPCTKQRKREGIVAMHVMFFKVILSHRLFSLPPFSHYSSWLAFRVPHAQVTTKF